MARATVRLIGGPTLVIEAGGLRLLTDPTFDQPGSFDVVLLSHDQHGLRRLDGVALRITGVPAQDGPNGTTHTGFVVSSVDTPAVYVSGGYASLDVVQQVAQRCAPIGIAVLFVDGSLTLTSDQAARAAAILASPTVIPAHVEGWDHDPGCLDDIRAAFARHGLSDRLRVLAAGDTATI